MPDQASRIKQTIRTQQRRERLMAAGLCIGCGQHEPAHGRKLCGQCLANQQVYYHRSIAKKQARDGEPKPRPINQGSSYQHPERAWYLTFRVED